MTNEEIRRAYWLGAVEDKKIVWAHSNISKYLSAQGVTLSPTEVLAIVGECTITAPCGLCGSPNIPFSAKSRSALISLARNVWSGGGRCADCWEKEQAAREAAAKAAAEKAAQEEQARIAAKLEAREARYQSVALKFGALFTGEVCPACLEGYLVVKLASTTQKPFLACSSYNRHRPSSCDFTQSLAPEFHDKYLAIFRARLMESELGVKFDERGLNAS